MQIARYLYKSYLYKCQRNGKTYYKMSFLSCNSGFYAESDEAAIEEFAQWCNVPTNCITRVA